uniref:BIG2 domain-containing protein n=1 Tax=Rhodnius prolixus TaxID=13249 RepID=T1I4Z7_RHOPR
MGQPAVRFCDSAFFTSGKCTNVRETIGKMGWKLLPLPPYNPDLVASRSIATKSVGFLKVDIPEKVERGSKFEAIVQLFFREDFPLKFPDLDLQETEISLMVNLPNIAEIIHTNVDRNADVVRFTLRALEVGETSVEARWKEIFSQQYSLQVFSPVKLSPKPLVLAVGAEIQLTVTGGPSPDPGLQFSSSDTGIGIISSSAVVKGLHVGSAVITVTSFAKQGSICSKDSVDLTVVLLSGVQIVVPILQLGIGRSMPAWPSGMPAFLSPLVLGSINPPLSFKWSVSLPGVVRLKDVLHSTNIEITNEDRLSMHILALKPGRTAIFLTVTGRGPDRNPIAFNSSVEIEVIETLEWYTPPISHATLLVAPNTHFTVKTNRDWVRSNTRNGILYQDLTVSEASGTSFRKKTNTALVTKEDIVEVDPTGTVAVGPKPGLAIIMAKSESHDTLTQQTVAFILQVKPIHYIMANVITELDVSGEALNHLPQGLNLVLNITYHDQYGTVFYSAPASIHGRANRFDKTWMSVGEMICFWSPVGGGQAGIWTADSDVISVTTSGLVVGNRLGTAVLTFSFNKPHANILSSVAVEVLPVITIDSSEPTFLRVGVATLKFKHTYSISVSVDGSYWARKIRPSDFFVTIYSPLTHQRSKVTVILEKDVMKSSNQFSFYMALTEFISQSRFLLLSAFATIVLTILIGYCYGMREVQNTRIPTSDQWYFRTPTHNELREHVMANLKQ